MSVIWCASNVEATSARSVFSTGVDAATLTDSVIEPRLELHVQPRLRVDADLEVVKSAVLKPCNSTCTV